MSSTMDWKSLEESITKGFKFARRQDLAIL
jgi:hypothetical protein